jgi:opacity protein-like surface antigen
MIKTLLLPVVGAILLSGPGWAQRVQNMDIYFLAGRAISSTMAIPGSNATVDKSGGWADSTGYGYQVARTSVASVWLDIAPTFAVGRITKASIPGSVNNDFTSLTAGLRFMIPLQSRLSAYGTLGGGGGSFNYPAMGGGATPSVLSNSTNHGVFQVGGGLDLRLTERISIRGEVRDFVTGRGLSGSNGPHHVVPLMGVAFHF